MLLHFSQTVLAAIVWTILLKSSAQETIPEKSKVSGLENDFTGEYSTKRIVHSWDLEKNIRVTTENELPNDETKSLSDSMGRPIDTGNDIVNDAVESTFEKRHVRQREPNQATSSSPIFTENIEENNIYPRATEYRKGDNDEDSISQHHPEASSEHEFPKENIFVLRDTDRGTGSSENRESNVSRATTTNETKKKDDNIVSNEALRLVGTLNSFISLINHSNAPGVSSQIRNLSLRTRSYQHYDSTSGVVLKTRSSSDTTKFMANSLLNNNSSEKDQPSAKAIESSRYDSRTNKQENVFPLEIQDTMSLPGTNVETKNYGKREKRMEKTFAGNTRNSISQTSIIWEKEHLRNIARKIQEKIIPDRASSPFEDFKYGTMGKTRLSHRWEGLSNANELSNIEAANKHGINSLTTKKRKMQQNQGTTGASRSFSTMGANLLEKKVNQVGTQSNVKRITTRFTTPGEILQEPPEQLFRQIFKPPDTRGRQAEMSFSMENMDEGYKNSTARYSVTRISHPRVFSESRHSRKPRSLEIEESYQRREHHQKLQKINYLGNERPERGSYFASLLNNETSEVNGGEARIAGGNKAVKNEMSVERHSDDRRNNEQVVTSTTPASDDNETFPTNQEVIDNPISPDSRAKKIYGNVVGTTLVSLQRDRGRHKTFIEQKSTGEFNPRSNRKQEEQVQERKKCGQKLSPDMRPVEIDETLDRHDEALSWRESLVNSEASASSWPVVKQESKLLNSMKSVTTGRTRKMEMSGRDDDDADDTRESRKIKNVAVDGSHGRDSFSNLSTKMDPRSLQFLKTTPMESNAAGDDSVTVKNRGKFMEQIYQPARTDTPSSMGSSMAEVYPWDFDSDDAEDNHHVRNDDGETIEARGLLGSRLQRNKVLYQRGENDGRGEISSNIRQKFKVRSIKLATQVSNASTTAEADIRLVNSSKVRFDNQRYEKNQLNDAEPDGSGAKNTASTFPEFITVLPNARIDKITGDTGDDTFVDSATKRHDYYRANEGFAGQENYIRASKIYEPNETSIPNRLKVRDSTGSNSEDTPENQGDPRNHISDKISNVKLCETCEIAANIGSDENDQREKFIFSDRERGGKKKIDHSITNVRVSKSTFRAEIMKENEASVHPNFNVGDGNNSLANTSAKLEAIDQPRPEGRINQRVRWKNMRTLVRGQEPITNEAEVRNLIVSNEGISAPRPPSLNIVKLSDSTERQISVDKTVDRRNESFLSASLEGESRTPGFRAAGWSNNKKKYETKHERFAETLANGNRTEFSNNASDIPGERRNFQLNSTFQTGSMSRRPWKISIRDNETTSSMGSRKIDSSVGSIDRLSYRDESSRIKDFIEHSQLDIPPSGILGDVARLSKARTKQIKRGFTSESTIPVTESPMQSHSYGSFVTTETNKVHDGKSVSLITDDSKRPSGTYSSIIKTVKSFEHDQLASNKIVSHSISDTTNSNFSVTNTGNYNSIVANLTLEPSSPLSSLIEDDKSSKTHHALANKIASTSVVDPTNVNVSFRDTGTRSAAFVSTVFEQDNNSTDESSRESSGLQLLRNKQQPHEMAEDVRGSAITRTLNQTIHGNSTRITATLNQWPVKHSAVVEGDLVLGGLMMVHEREDSVTCGPVMPQGGVQALEAMLYTLDWLNKHDLVPGVKIGAHILDDCDKDTYGLEMAVDFIKGSISNIDGAEYHCNKTAVRKVISGVVGAASSVTSIQVANLLRLFRIPQVSFFSTSPELSNKMRFEYFTRTIPSDHYQVKAMVDIVLVMGWSYVSIIYEESNYGEKAYEELEKLLGKHQICIAVKEKLSKDSGVAEAHVYDNIVLKLLTKPRARGCIIFASDQEVAGVMKAVRRCNATGAFSWIGSDGWSARSLVSDGNEPEMEGTLSVQPQANPVEGFEDYFLNLTVENNRRNPWFVEFWEDHFKCRYPNASQTPYNNYTEECTTTERLTKQNTAFEDQLQFVSDAVLAFAYAFRNMHEQLCHGKPGLCDAMKPTKGTELLSYLRTVEFEGLSGDVFHFDKNGDGPARYNIIHFKQILPGKYKWIRVGKYLEGELRLNMSEIQFRLGHPQAPESVCSLPCELGQAKKYVEGESCCWHCFNCSQYQIRDVNDEKQCNLCPKGTVPDETHSYCRDIPEEFLRPESGWAIGAMSFSSTGILITLFVGGVFLKHNDTPIVRASGRELSYVLLTGILLCYLVTFALVLRPTDLVCSVQRFSAGFCFTVVYAALLTKTNRISRIFNAGKRSAKRPSFISPRSQLIICGMLVAIQILINAVWMVIDPAMARHHYPTREDNLLVCNSYIDASYMIAFTYPIILIVVCTVYAVLTRKIPEAFNESKHIGFTMYTTCVIWLAFVPLYFATGNHVALRITSMSVTISLSASVTIVCLFTPKLYIILIHPERNVRPNMMQHRYNTTKASVVTATNASSMMAPVTLTAVTCDQNKAVKKHVITTTDCSTQSEQFEMELKEQKNGKIPASVTTRSTQTLLNNNGKDSSNVTSTVIKEINMEENITKAQNIGKIGNGPVSQNEGPL